MSAFRTLASTYLRRCALWWLPMLGVLIVFPCLIVWLVWCEAGTPGLWSSEADQLLASLQPPTFYVNFLYMMLIAGGAIAWGPLPDLFQKARISLLPVSNKTLGTFLWLLPACILMTFNLVVQHAYAWSFRNPWPILTTTICLGVLGTLLTALALWLRDFRFYKLPLAICAIGGWGYWYALHLYPNGFRKPPVLWDTFSSIDVVLLLAVAASSWQLTVAAFARYRCGEADFGQLLKYLDQPPYAMLSEKRSAVTLPPSQSAYSALLSLEWMKGRTIAITTAGILSCFFCLGLLAGIHDDRGKAITVLFPLIGMMYGVMSGLFLGIELCNAKNAQGEMKQCGTDTACVTIDVAPQPNECPEAVNDDFATCEDETLTGNVLINDGDVDGDTLTASPLTDVLTSEGGLVTLHQDGSFIYMPASGFSGVDTLTYSMSDGNGGTATATVSITVHDIADPQDDLFSGDEGTSIAGDVILNDGTVTAGSSVVVVDGPANGTLTLNTDGTFNYLPNDGFCGEDSFSYAINGPCQPSETANVRLVVSEIVWYTTIVSAGNNGQVWGDPHFEGDDGGLYDVQGEAGHIYNLLSDYGLQVNALFVPWEGHAGSTMVGAIGVRIGNDLIQANLSGTDVNGVELQAGGSRVIGATTVEFDGEYTTVTTAEYKLEFRRREGWMNMKLDAIDPFADNIAPHGLWGLTVDGDADPRNGDYFKDNWNYALQGGGALDTVDEDGNLVVSQRGDDSAYNLYSTEALNIAGDPFFRFDAAEGTGLERV